MKKVTIEPGCIACGTCQFIVPEVFKVTDVSRVNPEADIAQYKEKIALAIKRCPVSVIRSDES